MAAINTVFVVLLILGLASLALLLIKKVRAKKLLKLFLIAFGIGSIAGFSVFLYVFHKPHRNLASEKPAYIVEAKALYTEFNTDETASTAKYADKAIQLKGQIIDLTINDNGASIVLSDPTEGISCSFDSITVADNKEKLSNIKIGDEVTIKGKCDGFDMIMGVVLTRCVLVEE